MESKVRRPKRYVQPRIGIFSAMSPMEAWTDETSRGRYVEVACRNNGNDLSWSAFTNPDEVRRLGEWLIQAARWMEATT